MITQHRIRSVDHYVSGKQNVTGVVRPNSASCVSTGAKSSVSGNKTRRFHPSDLLTFERRGPLTVSKPFSNVTMDMNRVDPTFLLACKRSDEHTLRNLIHKQVLNEETVNQQDKTGRTGLSYVCSESHIPLLHLICDLIDVDVNLADSEGNTPLMLSTQAGHTEVVSFLLDKYRGSIDIDQRNRFGLTALMKAALQGRAKCVRLLLSEGASPILRDPSRRYSALEWARYCGRQTCVETIEKFIKTAPKRFSATFESKLVQSNSRSRRTSESELVSECILHPQLSKSDSENGWLRQKLRKTLRYDRSKKDLGTLGNMTANAMMCASSAILPNLDQPATSSGELPKRPAKPLPLMVPKVEVTHAPITIDPPEAMSNGNEDKNSKRKKN